jgi:hypothetical protein
VTRRETRPTLEPRLSPKDIQLAIVCFFVIPSAAIMDYWPRKGRPMLLAALETACDSVEQDLAAGA